MITDSYRGAFKISGPRANCLNQALQLLVHKSVYHKITMLTQNASIVKVRHCIIKSINYKSSALYN